MGKNKRKQIDYFDSFHNIQLQLDSMEEVDTLDWLLEAQELGLIVDWEYQPNSIELFQSVNYVNIDNKTRCLFREHIYSPDFKIQFNPSKNAILAKEFKLTKQQAQQENFEIVIDVKGVFNKTERAFSLNQKWVYQKTGIYVYKLVPKEFFKKAGCPKVCFITRKTGKKRKVYAGYKSISEIFNLSK